MYAPLEDGETVKRVTADSRGNIYMASTAAKAGTETNLQPDFDIVIRKLDSSGKQVYRFVFGGSGFDEPRALAVDQQGSLFVVGSTVSADFPLVKPLIASTGPSSPTGFVAKLDPTGSFLQFSTLLGGTLGATYFTNPVGTTVNAVALSAAENVYVTGTTSNTNFPVTANAYQTQGGGSDRIYAIFTQSAFVTEISNAGDRLIYSTYLHGSVTCPSGGLCPGLSRPIDSGLALSVDVDGSAVVGGLTNSLDFPTTPGAFQRTCKCGFGSGGGFITRVNSDGSGLVWSTLIGGGYTMDHIVVGNTIIAGLVLGPGGDVFIGGTAINGEFPVTPGAFQTNIPYLLGPIPPHGFIARLDRSGSSLRYSTLLGGSGFDSVTGISVSPDGRVHAAGVTTSTDFPALPASIRQGPEFVVQLESDGSKLTDAALLPPGSVGQDVIELAGGALVAGPHGSLSTPGPAGTASVVISGISNAAGLTVSGSVSPGELISIYGANLGPPSGLQGVADADGKLPTQLGQVQVFLDGKAIPLLYAGSGQINAILPAGLSIGSSTALLTSGPSSRSSAANLRVVPAQPAIFHQQPLWKTSLGYKFYSETYAAALNQDGTPNSVSNVAGKGTIVTIYATGTGPVTPQLPDGAITGLTLGALQMPVTVTALDERGMKQTAEVLYAGPAPGLANGVTQINFRLPALPGVNYCPIQLTVGGVISETVSIFTPSKY